MLPPPFQTSSEDGAAFGNRLARDLGLDEAYTAEMIATLKSDDNHYAYGAVNLTDPDIMKA